MPDFHQTGVITTLHRYPPTNLERLECELTKHSRSNPVALLLPCLFQELEGEALPRIVEELKQIPYLKQVVVSLGQATEAQFRRAREFFAALPHETVIVWNDGPRIAAVYDLLGKNRMRGGEPGKGRDVWIAMGYILADGKARVIASHGCDILTYQRELLARLCYPVVDPNMGYEYAKAYYVRVADRLYGRVTRLLVYPLIRTLIGLVGRHPLLLFLDSFRYPLAGESALTTSLARAIRIPGDSGLEIGLLGEVSRNCALQRICEVDVCDRYDHAHRPLDPDKIGAGLSQMATDIAKSLFRTLMSEGIELSDAFFRAVIPVYMRLAQISNKKYRDDAVLNGLVFDHHAERSAVEMFSCAIGQAAKAVIEDPSGTSPLPSWNRVADAVPDIFDVLKSAVQKDAKA